MLVPSFFFNDTATTEIYTLSLHDALPISTWRRTSEPQNGSQATTRPVGRCSRPASWTSTTATVPSGSGRRYRAPGWNMGSRSGGSGLIRRPHPFLTASGAADIVGVAQDLGVHGMGPGTAR